MFDFIHIGISDILDIIVVAVLFYQFYKLIRGTAAISIFTGILTLYVFWLGVRVLNMQLLSTILGQVLGVGVLALIIIFQQEIRRFLMHLGSRYQHSNFFQMLFNTDKEKSDWDMDAITRACRKMSESKTGALIVVARQSLLNVYAETGDVVDARISSRLLENLFFKNSPLHDGAIILKNNRIWAARCTLPITDNQNVPAHYGMRHRAAIGCTEQTDAVVITVSEETGIISVVEHGAIRTMSGANELRLTLESALKN